MKKDSPATGIDFADDFAHIAQLVKTAEGIRALASFSGKIPAGNEPYEKRAAAALAAIIKKNKISISNSAVVLPGSEALFRNSFLPATDAAEVDGMAALEMEFFTMMPPGEICVSWFPIGPSQPGGIRAGIIAAKKSDVRAATAIARAAGAKPRIVTSGGIAAANYFAPSIKDGQGPLVAVFGEPGGASVYIIEKSGLATTGSHIAANGGGLVCIEGLSSSIRLALQTAESDPPSGIVLFGKTEILPAPGEFENEFDAPARISDGAEFVADGSLASSQRAAGAALELFSESATGANLFIKESSAPARARIIKWVLGIGIPAAAIFLIILSIAFSIKLNERHANLTSLDKKIAELRPRAAELSRKRKALAKIKSDSGANTGCLDAILELSSILPSGVYVTNLVYGENNIISISAETGAHAQVSKSMRAIENSPMFSDVRLAYSRQTDVLTGAIVAFELNASINKGGGE